LASKVKFACFNDKYLIYRHYKYKNILLIQSKTTLFHTTIRPQYPPKVMKTITDLQNECRRNAIIVFWEEKSIRISNKNNGYYEQFRASLAGLNIYKKLDFFD